MRPTGRSFARSIRQHVRTAQIQATTGRQLCLHASPNEAVTGSVGQIDRAGNMVLTGLYDYGTFDTDSFG